MIFERFGLYTVVVKVKVYGRLDLTNAIPGGVVIVSALTGVDLDPQGFLGNNSHSTWKSRGEGIYSRWSLRSRTLSGMLDRGVISSELSSPFKRSRSS